MEMKYIIAMVIGLIVLIALFTFFKSKVDMTKDIIHIDEEGNTGLPDTSCYAKCTFTSINEGENYDNCAKNCG